MSQILEWYYFGDLVTLVVTGASACSTSNVIKDDELVQALAAICKSNKEELRKILNGEKNEYGEPKLFDVVRKLPSIQARSKYQWDESRKITVDLMTCNMDGFRHQILIAPGKIILPWPFPVDSKHELETCIDFTPQPLPNEPLLQIGPWLEIVDDLLLHDNTSTGKKYRKEFIEAVESNKTLQIILDYVKKIQGKTLPLPGNFRVRINKHIAPNVTSIESDEAIMYLNVGALGVSADSVIFEPLYEKWPCGAFKRNMASQERH